MFHEFWSKDVVASSPKRAAVTRNQYDAYLNRISVNKSLLRPPLERARSSRQAYVHAKVRLGGVSVVDRKIRIAQATVRPSELVFVVGDYSVRASPLSLTLLVAPRI